MKFAASILLCLMLAVLPMRATASADHGNDLAEIARVATTMVDGDVCQRILTPRALAYMLHPNPRDKWAGGDNYDVDDAAFVATKKTLMRLALLAPYPVDVNLWMPLPTTPPQIYVVIRNHYNLSQFWDSELQQKMPPEMQQVLSTGRTLTIRKEPGMVSILAPVRNSLGQIVGLVEVVSSTVPPLHDER
ncbi:MAG: hypothetical protein ABI164_01280 [Acidobacteriaceae bacterium]